MDLKQHIESLFRYINTYEMDYASFEAEAFIQTYNGIIATFGILRSERNDAVAADYVFLDFIQASPITSSDLRRLTIQILVSSFEAEVDVDGRSNQAYYYVRNLRSIKQDVKFIEKNLVQLLFKSGALNNNYTLHSFFLNELAKFLNTNGPDLPKILSLEEFNQLSDDLKFLNLFRRRLKFGTTLITERVDPEFHLQSLGSFQKLAAKSKIMHSYLSEWQYLQSESGLWDRVCKWFSVLGRKLMGAFTSLGYSHLVFRERRPAIVLNIVMIIVWITLAVLTPKLWGNYSDEKLEDLQNRSNIVNELLDKD